MNEEDDGAVTHESPLKIVPAAQQDSVPFVHFPPATAEHMMQVPVLTSSPKSTSHSVHLKSAILFEQCNASVGRELSREVVMLK